MCGYVEEGLEDDVNVEGCADCMLPTSICAKNWIVDDQRLTSKYRRRYHVYSFIQILILP